MLMTGGDAGPATGRQAEATKQANDKLSNQAVRRIDFLAQTFTNKAETRLAAQAYR